MSNPYGVPGAPSTPAPKSRTGLYVGLSCGCLLLVAVLIAVAGVALWLVSSSGEEEPTGGPATSETPTDEPTDEPTGDPTDEPTDEPTDGPSDGPVETPTEDPSEDPTSEPGTSLTVNVSEPSEGATLDTNDETLETENGKFIGVAVIITNEGDEAVGLANENFRFYDDQGEEYTLIYGSYSTSGPRIEPGEEATALLYADVEKDMVLESVSYTDEVGTAGEKITFPVS
ncbi:DUF4352 domain-containing protein [Brachybacterium sp. AOP43-C2-M15]|uniref:DUF4352 domain-containing protein n=1 Tax=Brachybacterium sp. AOP43-C2-M15 TaxID=3457661 RepID=UPI0040346E4C